MSRDEFEFTDDDLLFVLLMLSQQTESMDAETIAARVAPNDPAPGLARLVDTGDLALRRVPEQPTPNYELTDQGKERLSEAGFDL
jgi:hypothetical protein